MKGDIKMQIYIIFILLYIFPCLVAAIYIFLCAWKDRLRNTIVLRIQHKYASDDINKEREIDQYVSNQIYGRWYSFIILITSVNALNKTPRKTMIFMQPL